MLPFDEVASRLRLAEAGRRAVVATPFGRRLLTYADQTATGRSLGFVEAALAGVRPLHANTHTAISTTGRVMTRLREEARAAVAAAVHAGPDDVVLFTGSGATAAINKLVGLLGLRIDEPLERRYRFSDRIPAADFLAVNGIQAGQHVQMYLRDHWAGKLHKLGVQVIPYARLFGVDRETAYLAHIVTGEPILCEQVDTVVLAAGNRAETQVEDELGALGIELHLAGDCLSPRSAEEAVYEGLLAGRAV